MDKIKILFLSHHPKKTSSIGRLSQYFTNFLSLHSSIQLVYHQIDSIDPDIDSRFVNQDILFKNDSSLTDILKEGIHIAIVIGSPVICSNAVMNLNIFKQKTKFAQEHDSTAPVFYNGSLDSVNDFKIGVFLTPSSKFDKNNWIDKLAHNIDHYFVASEEWKDFLVQKNFNSGCITVIPPLVNPLVFQKIQNAREEFQILDEDDFIIFNPSKNKIRHNWDQTIRVFLKFLKSKNSANEIKLFINCPLQSKKGFNILELVKWNCELLTLNFEKIVDNHILSLENPGKLTDAQLVQVYNCADVILNTSSNVQLGLSTFEASLIGKPVISTRMGVMSEGLIPDVVVNLDQEYGMESFTSDEKYLDKLEKAYNKEMDLNYTIQCELEQGLKEFKKAIISMML